MIVLSFNQVGFEKAIEQKKESLNIYNKLLISFEIITAEKSILNLEQLDSFIQAKTGFANIQMSSQLLGIESEYNYIQQNANRYDLSEFVLNNDKVAIELKKEVVDALKEHFTTYLDKDKEKVFIKLQKALDLLNELHPYTFKAVTQDYNGKYSINKLALHNLNKI
jgi:hypothetical protein